MLETAPNVWCVPKIKILRQYFDVPRKRNGVSRGGWGWLEGVRGRRAACAACSQTVPLGRVLLAPDVFAISSPGGREWNEELFPLVKSNNRYYFHNMLIVKKKTKVLGTLYPEDRNFPSC